MANNYIIECICDECIWNHDKRCKCTESKNTVNPLTKNAVNIILLALDMLVLIVNTQLVNQQNALATNRQDLER